MTPTASVAAVNPAASLSAQGGPPAPVAPQADVQTFQRLLGQAGGTPAHTATSASANPSIQPGRTTTGASLSDAVSDGLKVAAQAYRSRFDALHAGLKQVEKSQSISSLLSWQLDSAKMGVEMEFTGKIVSKVVQDVEQLTKQQG